MICPRCKTDLGEDADMVDHLDVCSTIELAKRVRELELQNDEWKLLAGSLLQRVHDLGLHQTSIQFCEEPTCKAVVTRLSGKTEKPKKEIGTLAQWDEVERSEERESKKRVDVAAAVRKFNNTCQPHGVSDCRTCGLDG